MLEIALSFQNADGGQNRVIGKDRLFGNRIKDLLDRTRPLHPEHVHNPQLCFGQSSRLSRRHRMPSLDLRRSTKRKVTNSLVAEEAPWVARTGGGSSWASGWVQHGLNPSVATHFTNLPLCTSYSTRNGFCVLRSCQPSCAIRV